jgi:hypothetical protein
MDPVDNLAQSLLVGLVICSVMSDGYIMVKNVFHDKKTIENAEYCKDLLKVVTSYGLDKYKKTEDGKIIVEDEKKEPEVKQDIEKEIKREKPQEPLTEFTKGEFSESVPTVLTPWEQRGMTKEEYEQYRQKKKREKEQKEMEIERHERKSLKKEKNKSFPMHK